MGRREVALGHVDKSKVMYVRVCEMVMKASGKPG